MRAVNWPAFWRGYRRGVLQAYALAAVLLLVWALAGCASVKASPTLTAAVTLDELGAVFVQTGQAYNDLYRTGAIDAEVYRDWARFATAFQQAWLAAHAAIEAGATDGDTIRRALALKDALFRYALAAATRKHAQEKGTDT